MKLSLIVVFLIIVLNGNAQVINAYAKVSSIAGAVLTVTNVDEAAHTFEDGEWVVLMQMQDNVIGTTTNVVGFGSLGSILSAGRYEIRQIASHTETAGVPTSVTLTSTPVYTYNTGTNSSVQIISFRGYGAPNYTTTAAMSSKSWDGNTGGVLAFYVPGTLTIAHNLDANFDGFNGAGPNAGGSGGCSGGGTYRTTTQANNADKGESIFKRTTANQAAGMGRILNGGGGGNSHNGGGGGGGNYTAGGDGGPGYSGTAGGCSPSAGGLGGLSLSGSIDVARIFMGGGGGAGEGNNNLSTDGGSGGGIILIKANQIVTTACAGIQISANGESISFAGNDGGGGAGAGGSIVFEVNSWSVAPGCPITVSANGGNGGSVNDGAVHGGGGGGGQGVIFYSTPAPANVTNNTLNGIGGTVAAGSGGGSNNSGIQTSLTGPLPIELLDFNAELFNGTVQTTWITGSEIDNDYFIVQRSRGDDNWEDLGKVEGAGNSSFAINYNFDDRAPLIGFSYYRLKQVDFNGTYSYSEIKEVNNTGSGPVVYPNPTTGELFVSLEGLEDYDVYLTNSLGERIQLDFSISDNLLTYNLTNLSNGVYFVLLVKNEKVLSNRIILNR